MSGSIEESSLSHHQSRPLLFKTFLEEEPRQTRSLFTDGSKSAEVPYNEDKGWGYRMSQIASIFTMAAMAISKFLTRINEKYKAELQYVLGLQERQLQSHCQKLRK
jgi:hypothetical protein